MKKFYLTPILLLLTIQSIISQSNFIVMPKTPSIEIKNTPGTHQIVPIEFDLINQTNAIVNSKITIKSDFSTAPVISQISSNEQSKISIVNDNQTFTLNPKEGKEIKRIFYINVLNGLTVNYDKVFYIDVTDSGRIIYKIKVTIKPSDAPISTKDYLDWDGPHRLDYVTKVESNDNILTVSGEKIIDDDNNSLYTKKYVKLEKGESLIIGERFKLWRWNSYLKSNPLALITIPFKIRPEISEGGSKFYATANSGITNLGLNCEITKFQLDKYNASGKKTTIKAALGIWAAPSVEELDSLSTSGAGGKLGKGAGKIEKSKQFFVSTGLTLTFSYNDISFVIVPAGWDIGTTSIGNNWVYDKKWWWGFGIGISPKIFSTILNK
ncbi:MAG: hypothetical protein JNL75_06060 [Chitinophagales bacterium]|nr:hypothetical protein [Chitinophagales bacterium]